METRIYFKIKCCKKFKIEDKSAEISFMLEFNEDGECTSGESFNPISGWTNYTQWHTGWSESKDYDELYDAIMEFSTSMELEQVIGSVTEDDEGLKIPKDYYCTDYVQGKYNYTITIVTFILDE